MCIFIFHFHTFASRPPADAAAQPSTHSHIPMASGADARNCDARALRQTHRDTHAVRAHQIPPSHHHHVLTTQHVTPRHTSSRPDPQPPQAMQRHRTTATAVPCASHTDSSDHERTRMVRAAHMQHAADTPTTGTRNRSSTQSHSLHPWFEALRRTSSRVVQALGRIGAPSAQDTHLRSTQYARQHDAPDSADEQLDAGECPEATSSGETSTRGLHKPAPRNARPWRRPSEAIERASAFLYAIIAPGRQRPLTTATPPFRGGGCAGPPST